MDEPNLAFQLLAALITDPRTGVLFVLLVIAAVTDYRTYKIQNWLTVTGITFALIYNSAVPLLPDGGFLWALYGLLLGFFIMLPLYALNALGAGDVKLMAMVGAFLGAGATLNAVLFTFIVGGIAALGFGLFNKALGRMVSNVKNVVQIMVLSIIGGFKPDVQIDATTSVGRLPYGVSICIGTIAYVAARQLGYA